MVEKLCIQCNCFKRHYAKGYCKSCYTWNLTGRPIKNKKLDWLRRHKNYNGKNCLIFPFARNNAGYGQYNSPSSGRKKLAHRAMCRYKNGPAPSKRHFACHDCGNGHLGCVAPNHLTWKLQKDNALDRWSHGTINNNVLTYKRVKRIKKLIRLGKLSLASIGKKFNVSKVMIFKIKQGISWSHVP